MNVRFELMKKSAAKKRLAMKRAKFLLGVCLGLIFIYLCPQ
jgi:hypothetical protein